MGLHLLSNESVTCHYVAVHNFICCVGRLWWWAGYLIHSWYWWWNWNCWACQRHW